MRRTKIVATIGPATREPAMLGALIDAGVDVCRLNFAHAGPEVHAATAAAVRAVARAHGRWVGLLVDLPGPKLRTGPIEGEQVRLRDGAPFRLVAGEITGDATAVSTTVEDLATWVEPGDEIYLADGEIVLRVTDFEGKDVLTEVVRGGTLRSRKGMHVPGAEDRVRAFSDDDEEALGHALKLKADLVGLSFVRGPDDVARVRALLPKRGPRPVLVAKIETRAALANLEGIIAEADAVMVARGDLGIQTALHEVPLQQKQIIRACNSYGRPVITATQMLESMTRHPLPTRAEINDVANAVFDGTDALMLSEETAIGAHPVEAVAIMSALAESAEGFPHEHALPRHRELGDDRVAWAVAHAAVQAAEDLSVAAIVCPTRSGATPRRVAAFRPSMPIVGLSERRETLGALSLVWGVAPHPVEDLPAARDVAEEVERAAAAARRLGVAAPGDLLAVVAGAPGPRAGRTDFLRIVRA
jgi:pyruvate kinase